MLLSVPVTRCQGSGRLGAPGIVQSLSGQSADNALNSLQRNIIADSTMNFVYLFSDIACKHATKYLTRQEAF
jgi:hypothetical protein